MMATRLLTLSSRELSVVTALVAIAPKQLRGFHMDKRCLGQLSPTQLHSKNFSRQGSQLFLLTYLNQYTLYPEPPHVPWLLPITA